MGKDKMKLFGKHYNQDDNGNDGYYGDPGHCPDDNKDKCPEEFAPEEDKCPKECPPGKVIHYRIKAGDTFFKLAQRFGTTVEAIMALNPGVDPRNLQIGQIIHIPCGIPHPLG